MQSLLVEFVESTNHPTQGQLSPGVRGVRPPYNYKPILSLNFIETVRPLLWFLESTLGIRVVSLRKGSKFTGNHKISKTWHTSKVNRIKTHTSFGFLVPSETIINVYPKSRGWLHMNSPEKFRYECYSRIHTHYWQFSVTLSEGRCPTDLPRQTRLEKVKVLKSFRRPDSSVNCTKRVNFVYVKS